MTRTRAPAWLNLKNVERCLARAEWVRERATARDFIKIADLCEAIVHELEPGATIAEFFSECDEDEHDVLRVAIGFIIAEYHVRQRPRSKGYQFAKTFLGQVDEAMR